MAQQRKETKAYIGATWLLPKIFIPDPGTHLHLFCVLSQAVKPSKQRHLVLLVDVQAEISEL